MNKRILYLHPHFTLPGGAGRYALETGRVLAARGWDIHIVSIRHNPELVKEFTDAITFHELGGPLSNSLWYWPHLPALLRTVHRCIAQVAPDVVFSQVFPANWWGCIAARSRTRTWRHVWMCQEPSAFIHSKRWIKALPWNAPGIAARIGNPILKAIDTHLAQNVDYVFGNSQFCRSLTLATYGYNPEIVGISYPGVDTKRFTYNPTVPKASNAFVTCARLSAFKNIDRIIKALATIPDPSVSLTVIGNGEQYESLVQLTNTLQLQSRVKFLQTISDVQMIHEFQSSLALIHAAEEEPFGLTPVEAMACGTPVIAIRGGGPAETVVDGETGYLCASADERELAAGMQWALSHAHQMLEISRACAQRAQSFSWEEAANGLEAAFATR